MRKSTTVAIWLTLIMLLLVSAAAVVFLIQRNAQLEEDLQQVGTEAGQRQSALLATRDHLSSEITVRQAALDAASATRDTLVAEAELSSSQIQEMETSLAEQASKLSEAQETLSDLSVQLFIISPADGVTVPPLETLDIIASARANSGLDVVLLTVDGLEIARLPADGQTTLTAQAGWTPAGPGLFVIGSQALALDGQSTTTTVTVNAAYASAEAEQVALRRQMEEAAGDLRFPTPLTVTADLMPEETAAEDNRLHRLLLTGRDGDDEQALAADALTLQALDLLFSDAGLRTYLETVAEGDLSAYYNPLTESLTVYRADEQSGAFGRWLGIHGLAHDLQAERLGLDGVDVTAMDGDERLAFRALVEGDAAFLQHLLLQGELFTDDELAEVKSGLSANATDVTAALPIPFQETFEFAYTAGVPFVAFLYDLGGFGAVDSAWNDIPVSSEQIIHPERYLAGDVPKPVSLAPLNDTLGEGWRLVGEDTFGEFQLRQHLGRQSLPVDSIDQAATGWGGGRYAVYQDEENQIPVLLLRLAWDRTEDEREFSELYAGYLGLRYGGEEQTLPGDIRCWQADGVGCLFSAVGDTFVIRAPDLETAAALAEAQLNMSQP